MSLSSILNNLLGLFKNKPRFLVSKTKLPYFNIHVCIVSNQAAPNFFPVLDNYFKPQKVILLISPKMHELGKDKNLKKALLMKDVEIEEYFLESDDLELLSQEVNNILIKYKNENIALNMTGGSKIMALTANKLFNDHQKPSFYYENGSILLLDNWQTYPLNCHPDIESYLVSYGNKHIKSSNDIIADNYIEAAEHIAHHAKKYTSIIRFINYASMEAAETRNLTVTFDTKKKDIMAFLSFLKELEIVDIWGDDLDFLNEENRNYLNGGWLEYYLYHIVKNLHQPGIHIQDVRYNYESGNAKFNQEKADVDFNNLGRKKESDVIFMVNNKLYIIECKTCKMDDVKVVKGYIDNLKNKKELGGVETEVCLASFQKMLPASLNYAESEGVQVIKGKHFPIVEQKLVEWINKK